MRYARFSFRAIAPAWELNGLKDYLWMASAARLFTDFVEEEPELNPVKYESFATNSAIQLSTVLDKVQTLLSQYRQIDLPVLTSRLTYNPWFKETARALVEFVRMQEKP